MNNSDIKFTLKNHKLQESAYAKSIFASN